MPISIYQDFLPDFHFADIQKLFMTSVLDWHFTDRVVSTERHFMFGHTFMEDGQVINPKFFEPVRGMLHPMQQKLDFIGVSRIRAVLYTNPLLLFENVSHYGTVQTDTDTRVVINFTLRLG